MRDMSEKLICEIQLQVAPGGQVVTSPSHYHMRNLDKVFETYRFFGSIRSLEACSNDISATPRKILSLLLSRGVKILLVRLDSSESKVGFAFFRLCDVVKWQTGLSLSNSWHLTIEVSRDEWESLDFYVDGESPHLVKYELDQ